MDESKKIGFKLEDLEKFSGKDGNSAYFAYNGDVFDVSKSSRWKDGKHMGLHSAGKDLSKFILNAPHKHEVLVRFPIVGYLVSEEKVHETLVQKIAGFYPHSILVHFPIAFATLVPFFSVLYFLTGNSSFELTSYYILALNVLAGPAGALSGAFSWKVRYNSAATVAFFTKIRLSLVFFLGILISFIWRTLDSQVLVSNTSLSYFYLLIQIGLALIASLLGHTGGKIVFE